MPNLDPVRDEANKEQTQPGKADPITPLSLLERARANDAAAWDQLVKLYRPLVLFWCRRGVLVAQDAEDLSQEVLARAWEKLELFHRDQPGDTFRGWLRVLSRNQILLHFRRNAHQPQAVGGAEALARLHEVADPLTGCEVEEEVEFNRVCHRALEIVRGDFEEKTVQAFWLVVVEKREPASLTTELGMSAAAIRQAKSRVLRRLKQELGELRG